MKRIFAMLASIVLTAFAAFALAAPANAANETATVDLKMDPLGGSLYKDAFKPVNWQVETKIDVPPGTPKILPMKVADIKNPKGQLTFNIDPKMPVCPDSAINKDTVSVEVPVAVAACPKAVLGNGTAKFALAQLSNSSLDGVMVVFNGGKQASGPLKGQPRLKIYAYSYDTGVGLYTEAALAKNGQLRFEIPPLTADSSVTSLNLAIPGKPTNVFVESKQLNVTLPAGQDKNYAQAKCSGSSWGFKASFDLGTRDTAGQPVSPTETIGSEATTPCNGLAGKPRFAGLKVKGPGKAKFKRAAVYRVTVKNNGTATAKRGRLVVKGKGVKGRANFGNLAAGASKTVRVKVKFNKRGRVKAQFRATAAKAKVKAANRVVRVR